MSVKPTPELRFDASPQHPHPLMALLRPVKGERILDLGCGQGFWATKIAAAGAAVTGVDTDARALSVLQDRDVAGIQDIAVRECDGRALDYDHAFDAVFTNAALHWMPPISDAVRGVYSALKPGGRFVGEFGGHGNIASIRVALKHGFALAGLDFSDYDPWEFPTTPAFCDLLQNSGFDIDHIDTFPRLTPLPMGFAHWLEHFMGSIFEGLPDGKGAAVKSNTLSILRDVMSRGGDDWIADYVRIRFRARKPA